MFKGFTMVYLATFVFTHLQYKDITDRHAQKRVERVVLKEASVIHLPRGEWSCAMDEQ